MNEDSNNWRDWVCTNKRGVSSAVSSDVTKTTRLYVNCSYYEQHAVGMNAFVDNFAGWDDVSLYSGLHLGNGASTLSTSNVGYGGAAILDEDATPAGLCDLTAPNSYFNLPSRSFTNHGPEPTSINWLRDDSVRLEKRVGTR